jgi:hypothetical protein
MSEEKTKEELYNFYITSRNSYVEKQYDQCKQYDQAMSIISSGVFGITIAFLKEVVKNPIKNTSILIIIGWALVLVSICFSLIAYIITYYAYRVEIRNFDIKIENISRIIPLNLKTNHFTTIGEILNIVNLITLISGLAFIVIYIGKNL